MAGEWEYLSLQEAGVKLIDCVHKTPPNAGEGYPYIAIPQMNEGRIDFSANPRRISHEDFLAWTAKAKPRANDVILSRRCNPGETAYVPDGTEFALGQNLVLLRSDGTHVHPTFLRWLVRGPQWWDQIARFLNVGAVFDSLRCADVPKVELPIPPLPEQRAIADILGALDDKIELNRQMSETLEAMARALFKSWFVDFDPVRAKAEGRDPGLPKHIADLFPERLVNSELGEIPEGWEVRPLSECVDVVRGLSYKGSGLADHGLPMHNLNSIYEGGGYKHDGLKYYCGDYKEKHEVRAGDLIIANTEQGHDRLLIGHAAVVPDRFGDASLFSHHIYRVRAKGHSDLTPDYLFRLLNSPVMHEVIGGYANGTTVNMLPMDALQMPGVAIPRRSLIDAYDTIASTARRRQEEMVLESETLASLRDALLPKLSSGELRVGSALTFIKELQC